MTKVRPTLNVCLSVCLAAQPLFAAGSPRPQASRFPAEHEAALAKAAEAFVAAGPVDAEALVTPLVPLATDPEDKSDLARFRALLKEAAALREPVAAKPGAPADGPVPEILDAKYKSRVLALALKLSADGAKAAETRRELLRKNPPVGPDGKPAAAVPGAGQPPLTDRDRAAIARMEARGGLNDPRMKASADRTAAALGRFKDGGDLPAAAGATPADGGRPDPAAAELLGVANAAFKGGPNTLATQAPKDPHAAAPHPPAEKGWWGKFRDATTIDSLQHKFEAHNKEKMAVAGRYEDQSAEAFAKGSWGKGAGMAVAAWGTRLWAGDSATVQQVAIGAGVAVAAAALVFPATILGATVAAAGVGTKVFFAGLAGATAFNVVNGVGHFAHKPDLVNGVLLAANAVAIPGLAKASHLVVGRTLALTGVSARTAAASGGTVAVAAATPELAVAGASATRTVVAAASVETAAAQTATQVAVRNSATLERLAIQGTEKVGHLTTHTAAETAAAVKSDHH